MGPVRGFILMILFLIPEFAKFIYPFCQGPAQYFREIFWDSLNTREKIGKKRGDFIDSLIALKNGEQNPEYSKIRFSKKNYVSNFFFLSRQI